MLYLSYTSFTSFSFWACYLELISFFSHAIDTNRFSKCMAVAFLGQWDLSSVTDVAQVGRWLFILHRDALLLGYKFSQTSADKLLSKSIKTERASSENSLQSGKGEQWQLSLQFVSQAVWGCTTCLWACSSHTSGKSSLTPILAGGWRLRFCTHKGKTNLVMNET